MIDLEKMERLAGELAPLRYNTDACKLARAVLAMLPVIKASIDWRTTPPSVSNSTVPWVRALTKMEQAIDTLRRQMQEGE
jgi:hypothetical protein